MTSISLWQMARAWSMQFAQGPEAEHWTAVVGRPSRVKSGALPPHPASMSAPRDAAVTARTNALAGN
ncbi:hypothetical protein [Trinickia sp. Y13]|uniref:hypothetical protein n=1 Tax=Trinickia sp. Y13 TaxID=2917807 RepID=UPI0024063DFC|nr:hypothetical protein [Trinickia sp. Y13]MDG0024464.1 hypothetical protein [Trinickia sp. Y13]